MGNHVRTAFDNARDDLFAQIHRCGVLDALPDQQQEWLRDTRGYLESVFPELTDRELNELMELGERFCQPPIPHGKANTELTRDEWEAEGTESVDAGTTEQATSSV